MAVGARERTGFWVDVAMQRTRLGRAWQEVAKLRWVSEEDAIETGIPPASGRRMRDGMVRAAVVLCGSGRFDGSEIQESVLSLLHLERHGVAWQAFAPDAPQWAVCEHFEGAVVAGEQRSQLAEAARIARGRVLPLDQARAESFDLLVLPGGTGAAKNLCSFAERGAEGEVIAELDALLRAFHAAAKPIAAICIAPAIVALSLGAHAPTLTLGAANGEPAQRAAATGARFVDCSVDEAVVDSDHRIVSTPAYILGPDLVDVDRGIGRCISEALRLCPS